MLFQCHWQDRADFRQTEFLAQAEFTDADPPDALQEWSMRVFERRASSRLDGWVPMICTEDSEYFVRAAGPGKLLPDEPLVR